MPLLAPVADKLGIDLIWFGVLLCVNMQTSFMHPPFGFALFYLRGIADQIFKNKTIPRPILSKDIYLGAIPWVVMQLILVARRDRLAGLGDLLARQGGEDRLDKASEMLREMGGRGAPCDADAWNPELPGAAVERAEADPMEEDPPPDAAATPTRRSERSAQAQRKSPDAWQRGLQAAAQARSIVRAFAVCMKSSKPGFGEAEPQVGVAAEPEKSS